MTSVILFYAHWCGHCKVFQPEWSSWIPEFEKKYKDIKFETIESDELSQDRWKNIHIEGYPTIMVIKNNEQIIFNGNRNKESIESWIQLFISKQKEQFTNNDTINNDKSIKNKMTEFIKTYFVWLIIMLLLIYIFWYKMPNIKEWFYHNNPFDRIATTL